MFAPTLVPLIDAKAAKLRLWLDAAADAEDVVKTKRDLKTLAAGEALFKSAALPNQKQESDKLADEARRYQTFLDVLAELRKQTDPFQLLKTQS